jgi:hypothetical protein
VPARSAKTAARTQSQLDTAIETLRNCERARMRSSETAGCDLSAPRNLSERRHGQCDLLEAAATTAFQIWFRAHWFRARARAR